MPKILNMQRYIASGVSETLRERLGEIETALTAEGAEGVQRVVEIDRDFLEASQCIHAAEAALLNSGNVHLGIQKYWEAYNLAIEKHEWSIFSRKIAHDLVNSTIKVARKAIDQYNKIMNKMADTTADIRTLSDNKLRELQRAVAAEIERRETLAHTPAEPRPTAERLKWKKDRLLGEDVAHFAARAYAAEIADDTFDKSLIRRNDRTLYQCLFREKAWDALGALIQADVRTKPQRNTERLRELLARGEQPSRSEDIGLYEAGRYRVAHAKP
jgi:hypothetical protein